MVKQDQASMYLVAIVGIVAAVGIVVLLMGSGLSLSGDYTGQAVAGKKISKTKTWFLMSDEGEITEIEVKTPEEITPINEEGGACECGLCMKANGMGTYSCAKGESSKCP